MSIPRGTTPTFQLIFPTDVDLSLTRNMYVTFKTRNMKVPITKSGADISISGRIVYVTLTQEESLQFLEGDLEIQANWTTLWNERMATEIYIYPISKQLLLEVIP